MKREMFKKLMAVSLATAMTVGMTACGDTPASSEQGSSETPASSESTASSETPASTEASSEEVEYLPVIKGADGNPIDLGGMEIIVRDWWTTEDQWNQMANEPETAYEMARAEYWQWIQDTYNFKIKREQIGDWGSVPQDFVDYATNPADDKNYVFTVREDAAITAACYNGLVYDLSTLDCLDFSETKFTQNRLHEQWTFGDKIYAMYAGVSEPRTGVFFNTELLEAVNIKADDLYQWQTNGEWTWDKWIEVMNAVQRDTNNDGAIDVYGTTQNNGVMVESCVYSNGGEFIGKENGKFVLKLEEQNTVDGLEFAVKILDNYTFPYPQDAQWDYYKEAFKSGQAAFMPEDAYNITGMAKDWEFEYGYLMFPKGPNATNNDYTNRWSNNPSLIPANYDAERAWKIAFAWNLFTDPIPGYEDYDPQIENYMKATTDPRVAELTCAMQTKKGMVTHAGMVPNVNMGPDLIWNISAGAVVSEKIDAIKGTWQEYIDAANNK